MLEYTLTKGIYSNTVLKYVYEVLVQYLPLLPHNIPLHLLYVTAVCTSQINILHPNHEVSLCKIRYIVTNLTTQKDVK